MYTWSVRFSESASSFCFWRKKKKIFSMREFIIKVLGQKWYMTRPFLLLTLEKIIKYAHTGILLCNIALLKNLFVKLVNYISSWISWNFCDKSISRNFCEMYKRIHISISQCVYFRQRPISKFTYLQLLFHFCEFLL